MWIHVTRGRDPMAMQFGKTSGYLIFTDLGDRIERAVFGGSAGAVEQIDVWGSENVARAFAGYNYDNSDPRQGYSVPEVFNEITEFVAERDPQKIAVNYSDFLVVADGSWSRMALRRCAQRIRGLRDIEHIVHRASEFDHPAKLGVPGARRPAPDIQMPLAA